MRRREIRPQVVDDHRSRAPERDLEHVVSFVRTHRDVVVARRAHRASTCFEAEADDAAPPELKGLDRAPGNESKRSLDPLAVEEKRRLRRSQLPPDRGEDDYHDQRGSDTELGPPSHRRVEPPGREDDAKD